MVEPSVSLTLRAFIDVQAAASSGSHVSNQLNSLMVLCDYILEKQMKLKAYLDSPSDFGPHSSAEKGAAQVIREVCNTLYSFMEITNQIFIVLFKADQRYRGSTLLNGYNSNFKRIVKSKQSGKPCLGVWGDNMLRSFCLDSEAWWVPIHDIRTQETHYEVGQVIFCGQSGVYKNRNRNGVSKELYTNAPDSICKPLEEIVVVVDLWSDQIDQLLNIVSSQFHCLEQGECSTI